MSWHINVVQQTNESNSMFGVFCCCCFSVPLSGLMIYIFTSSSCQHAFKLTSSNNVRGVLLERETLLCALLMWSWLTSAALLASCFAVVQTLGWSMDVWVGVAAKDVGRQCCLSVTSWCFLYALLCTTLYMQTYPQFMEVDYTQTCLVAFQFCFVFG